MNTLAGIWIRLRHAVWRWRFKRFIIETRGWHPGRRAVCLALGTGESSAFVHDALFRETNAEGQPRREAT
jgi:hypothetical protein